MTWSLSENPVRRSQKREEHTVWGDLIPSIQFTIE